MSELPKISLPLDSLGSIESLIVPAGQENFPEPGGRLAQNSLLTDDLVNIRVKLKNECAVRLGEIRSFTSRGKRYVFVIPVTGIFEVSDLAFEIIGLLRPRAAEIDAIAALQVPETNLLSPAEILSALRPRHSRDAILRTLGELRAIGAVAFGGFREEPAKAIPFQPPPVPFPQRSLVLNVANSCNLGCTYCFASQGDYGAPKRLMTEETALKSVDFLLHNSGDHRKVTLVFFGGEPLMNFPLIRKTVDYAVQAGQRAGKQVEFSITTNATMLTSEVVDFFIDHRVGVTVSIDGPREYHDKRRIFKNGLGSYDVIAPRIQNLLARHKSGLVAARVTLTRGVTAALDIFWHLSKMGFSEIGFAPVTSADTDEQVLSTEELWAVQSEFRELAKIYVEKAAKNEYLGFSNLSNLLSDLHLGVVKAYPCGAGMGLLGVGVTGDLYLCHRFLESEGHRMGNLDQGVDMEKQAEFLARAHVSQKPPCQVCWVRNICSGGCHHEAFTRYGDLHHGNFHYCEWLRSWIDLGLQSYTDIGERNPEFFAKFIEKQEG